MTEPGVPLSTERTLTDEARAAVEQLLTDMTRPLMVWRFARALTPQPGQTVRPPMKGAMKRRDGALIEIIDMMAEFFITSIDQALKGECDDTT